MKIKIVLSLKSLKNKFIKSLEVFTLFAFTPKILGQLVKNELKSFFYNPVTYGIGILFLILTFILFFESYGYAKIPTDDLTSMFSSMAIAMVVIIPALTMNSVSKDRQTGLIEYYLTQPIKEFDFILGKFASVGILVILLILSTLPTTLIINFYGTLDLGQIIVQYLGLILLSLAFTAIGIFISALFKSEVISFISTFVFISFIMALGSQFLQILPIDFQSAFGVFSPLLRYQNLGRGVIEVSDVLYFFMVIVLFLFSARYFIGKLRLPIFHKAHFQLRSLVLLTTLIFIFTAYFSPMLNLRIDGTSNKKFSLSRESVQILNKLNNPIDVKLFTSNNLPLEVQPVLNRATNLLKDYQAARPDKFKLSFVNFELKDDNKIKEASSYNIFGQSILVASDDSASTTAGIAGIGFEYDGVKAGFNLGNDVSNLEFQISKTIMQLAKIERPIIGIVENSVSLNYKNGFTQYPRLISDFFDFRDIILSENENKLDELAALIVLGPTEDFTENMGKVLKQFYDSGKSLMLFYDTVIITDLQLEAKKRITPIDNLFNDIGIKPNYDFVLDINSNLIGSIPQPPFFKRFPQYPIILPSKKAYEMFSDPAVVNTFLPSTLTIENDSIDVLYTTSEYAYVSENLTEINKNVNQQDKLMIKDVIVSVSNKLDGRLVISSDSFMFSDELYSRFGSSKSMYVQQNAIFLTNILEWLSKPSINISTILGKTDQVKVLPLDDLSKSTMLTLSSFASGFYLAIFASVAFSFRRKFRNKVYEAE